MTTVVFCHSYILDLQIFSSNKLKISSPIWLIAGVWVISINSVHYIISIELCTSLLMISRIKISLDYPIDNKNGHKKVGLIRTYFVYSFYNVEKDEKIHLKNGETLPVKRGSYAKKDIEKVSSGKVKYDSMTGKSVINPTITRFGPYMNKIPGINNGNYIDMLLSKKCFHLRSTNCQPLTTYSMANHVTYCILATSIKTYHLEISFTLSQRMFSIKS